MFFKQKSYDYEDLAKKFSKLVAQNSASGPFYCDVLKFIVEAVESEGGSLVLKENEAYTVKQCLGWESFAFRMEECLGLIQWLKKNHVAITRQQLLDDPHFAPVKNVGLQFFVQFQGEVCLPLYAQGELLGLVTLAPKRKGKPYTKQSLILLDWLGAQVALHLQNILLKDQMRQQTMDLEGVKDLKSQIISNLSHELRTPLTGIIGFSELLAEEIDGSLNQEQKRHLVQIQSGAERLLKILSALVDMAQLEAGNLSLHVQQFHLAPLVGSLSDEIPFNSETALKISLESTTPRIYGDVNLVRQIFKHLLDNAAKYTPKGEVLISADKKGEMLEVCVSDTGIGIAEDKLTRIFDGFYQVNGGLTRQFQGPGIGLSLSKKLIELHGGHLWVKSAPGRGSRFYFTLPLKPIAIRHRELAA
ncbi:MAG: HAMP domain-containing sensor histidine kinase [Deltaproteobacteria bacterium]|nr:HAMP domain-containing sensor histidine kinase [Deltaproteobacteria bacterium]